VGVLDALLIASTVIIFVSVLLFAGFYTMVLIEKLKEDYMEDYGNYGEEE
jgi:hypothetical protein